MKEYQDMSRRSFLKSLSAGIAAAGMGMKSYGQQDVSGTGTEADPQTLTEPEVAQIYGSIYLIAKDGNHWFRPKIEGNFIENMVKTDDNGILITGPSRGPFVEYINGRKVVGPDLRTIYRSDDQGETYWPIAHDGLYFPEMYKFDGIPSKLKKDPDGNIWMVTYNEDKKLFELYKSENGGYDWNFKSDFLQDESFSDIQFVNGELHYISEENSPKDYRLDENGIIIDYVEIPIDSVLSYLIDSHGRIYVSDFRTADYKFSEDNGKTWSNTIEIIPWEGGPPPNAQKFIESPDGEIFALMFNPARIMATKNGKDWYPRFGPYADNWESSVFGMKPYNKNWIVAVNDAWNDVLKSSEHIYIDGDFTDFKEHIGTLKKDPFFVGSSNAITGMEFVDNGMLIATKLGQYLLPYNSVFTNPEQTTPVKNWGLY